MITELGDKIGIVIVAFIIAIWLVTVKKPDFIGMIYFDLLAVAVGNEISKLLKDFIGRERPETAQLTETLSFPSGHAMVGLILYFISTYLIISIFIRLSSNGESA